MTSAQKDAIILALKHHVELLERGGAPLDGYYTDGVGGLEWHESAAEANSYATVELEGASDDAADVGWPEEVEMISWGVLVVVESAVPVSRKESCDPRFTEVVKYRLMSPIGHVEPQLQASDCGDDECEKCHGGQHDDAEVVGEPEAEEQHGSTESYHCTRCGWSGKEARQFGVLSVCKDCNYVVLKVGVDMGRGV